MRTLKKTLCLVLSVVMVLGLCTFGVNAQMSATDYPDADKITNTEAVDILGAIGVLEGDDDGFRPGDTLKRSEGAKIITTMMGVNVPSNATSKFTDAQGHWAEAYIAYCTEQGIIDGMTETTFEPESKLTGAQFAKMLLCALGYDAEIEGLTGSAWILNVASLIKTAKLDADLAAIPYEAAVTRDEAAQMAFNALIAPLVTYNASTNVIVNGIPVTINAGKAIYMTDVARDTQTISYAQINDGSAKGVFIVEFAEKYQPDLVRSTMTNDEWGAPTTTWTYKRAEINSYVNDDLLVHYSNKGTNAEDINTKLGTELIRQLANSYNAEEAVVECYVDGVETTDSITWKAIEKKDKDAKIGGAGTEVFVYLDEYTYEGKVSETTTRMPKITIVAKNTWLAEVTSVEGKGLLTVIEDYTEEISGKTYNNAAGISDYEEGDMVLVNICKSGKNPVPEIIQLAGIDIDQFISGYTSTSTDAEGVNNSAAGKDETKSLIKTFTIEGDKKEKAVNAYWNDEILHNYSLEKLRGFTYDVYYDQFDNVIGLNYNQTDSSYVFVTGYESASSYLAATTAKVNVIWTDGATETLTVKLSNTAREYLKAVSEDPGTNNDKGRGDDKKGTVGSAVVNRWFTASTDSKGAVTLANVVTGAADQTYKGRSSVRQWSYDVYNGSKTSNDVKINSANTTLAYLTQLKGASMYAYGNDKSVYITVAAEESPVDGGAITKVNGVSTGIKNTNITVLNIQGSKNADKLDNFKKYGLTDGNNKNDDVTGMSAWSNVYYMYDKDSHYVLYAVVVSENVGGTVVYINDNIDGRELIDDTYYDSYKAIWDGRQSTLKVDSLATETTYEKLVKGHLYNVSFDENGYVIVAKDLIDPKETLDLKSEENGKRGYAYATNIGKDQLTLKDGTLWIGKDGQDNNGYIVLDKQATYFISGKSDAYKNVDSAVSAAGGLGKITAVYAICDANGFATTVIFSTDASKGVENNKPLDSGVEIEKYNSADDTYYWYAENSAKNDKTLTDKEKQELLVKVGGYTAASPGTEANEWDVSTSYGKLTIKPTFTRVFEVSYGGNTYYVKAETELKAKGILKNEWEKSGVTLPATFAYSATNLSEDTVKGGSVVIDTTISSIDRDITITDVTTPLSASATEKLLSGKTVAVNVNVEFGDVGKAVELKNSKITMKAGKDSGNKTTLTIRGPFTLDGGYIDGDKDDANWHVLVAASAEKDATKYDLTLLNKARIGATTADKLGDATEVTAKNAGVGCIIRVATINTDSIDFIGDDKDGSTVGFTELYHANGDKSDKNDPVVFNYGDKKTGAANDVKVEIIGEVKTAIYFKENVYTEVTINTENATAGKDGSVTTERTFGENVDSEAVKTETSEGKDAVTPKVEVNPEKDGDVTVGSDTLKLIPTVTGVKSVARAEDGSPIKDEKIETTVATTTASALQNARWVADNVIVVDVTLNANPSEIKLHYNSNGKEKGTGNWIGIGFKDSALNESKDATMITWLGSFSNKTVAERLDQFKEQKNWGGFSDKIDGGVSRYWDLAKGGTVYMVLKASTTAGSKSWTTLGGAAVDGKEAKTEVYIVYQITTTATASKDVFPTEAESAEDKDNAEVKEETQSISITAEDVPVIVPPTEEDSQVD